MHQTVKLWLFLWIDLQAEAQTWICGHRTWRASFLHVPDIKWWSFLRDIELHELVQVIKLENSTSSSTSNAILETTPPPSKKKMRGLATVRKKNSSSHAHAGQVGLKFFDLDSPTLQAWTANHTEFEIKLASLVGQGTRIRAIMCAKDESWSLVSSSYFGLIFKFKPEIENQAQKAKRGPTLRQRSTKLLASSSSSSSYRVGN